MNRAPLVDAVLENLGLERLRRSAA